MALFRKSVKMLIVTITLIVFLTGKANAGFAPQDWTYRSSNGGGSGSISSTSLSLVSPNTGVISSQYVEYSIVIPADSVSYIDIPWTYRSTDVNGPFYDLPEYIISSGGSNQQQGYIYYADPGSPDSNVYSGLLRLPIGTYKGSTFTLRLNASDNQLGSGYLDIASFDLREKKKASCYSFSNSSSGTDKICDPDGSLRKLIDSINKK